jgi:hypothetical protein
MHDVALMEIAMIDAVTSSTIVIVIRMMNVNWGSIFASNTPLATGKTTVAIIIQKKRATRNIGAKARYRSPHPLIPKQTGEKYMG